MKTAIIIPARYGSSRFPGKPLAKIGGRTMLERVVALGRAATAAHGNVTLAVATEDRRIADHCAEIGAPCFMTSPDCPTGSDRVLEAARLAGGDFDYIFSLQGDIPFTHPKILTAMLNGLNERGNTIEVITPVYQLSWKDLADLEDAKKQTPFSGTTVVRHNFDNEETGAKAGNAIWFSKNIIPAIRNRDKQETSEDLSPVFKHIGVYGYRSDVLKKFASLEQGHYEKLEGLEQLRLIENNISIFTVKISFTKEESLFLKRLQGGIDSPEDLGRVEAIIAEHGEPF